MLLPIIPGVGDGVSTVGSLSSNNTSTVTGGPARVVGTPTTATSSISQVTQLSISPSHTHPAGANAIIVALGVTLGTTTLTAADTLTCSFGATGLTAFTSNASGSAKNAPQCVIFAGLVAGNQTDDVTIVANHNNITVLSHIYSIISVSNVASFGNSVQSASSSRSTVSMTATGITNGDLIAGMGMFQGGGTNWTPSAGWNARANLGSNGSDEFNDSTVLLQTFDATAAGNVAFDMDLNSAFGGGAENASGLIVTATSTGT